MKLVWSQEALRDLVDIADYIAFDDPIAARRWIKRLRDRARRAARIPNAGRKVPERDDETIREVIVGNHRIIYRVEQRSIIVLTVLEGHRQLPH
jgi:toxin ParE1/3/4